MKIVILCHPSTLDSASMPRFARMIGEGMRDRGHAVEYWTSPHIFARLPVSKAVLRKWLGYIDQFLIFPIVLRWRAWLRRRQTLFVVSDQALGMWVPAIRNRPHVIHCHDFLAQRSALGEFPENPTGWTGRRYQALIRRGYRMGRAFLSVSWKTREDLHRFLGTGDVRSGVVYNPINKVFRPLSLDEARARLPQWLAREEGFLLHVGGNQWYKNRAGVLRIYREYSRKEARPLPLVMIGRPPDRELGRIVDGMEGKGRVVFESGFSDEQVCAAYSLATALVFPSLEEGFGWPIAEAQASGCPVLTTGGAPMNEVGGDAAFYMPRMPSGDAAAIGEWSRSGAAELRRVIDMTAAERSAIRERGFQNAARFELSDTMERIEDFYRETLAMAS